MRQLVLLGAMLTALVAPAQAAFESAYTDLDLDDCLLLEADDFGARWSCPGYRGYPMFVAEGDLRFFVGYGFEAPRSVAAGQTLPPFNYLGPRVEWRLSNATGRWLPVATIVRFFTDIEAGQGSNQVLVVTQIDWQDEDNSCHIAYIDATANADANQMARDAADRLAGTFECAGSEIERIGPFEAF
jgi:hypothetical protein